MRYGSQTRSTGVSRNRKTNVKQARVIRARAFVTEVLERRLLLSSTLRAAIVNQVDPATTQQTLFVPGMSSVQVNTPGAVGAIGSTFFRFTLDNTAVGQTTTFSSTENVFLDTALALYDGDGNLLQVVDADKPAVGIEQLTVALDSGKPYILGVYDRNLFLHQTVTLTADTGPQRVNSTIAIGPNTGTADFLANSGADTFTSPTDVNYFPLDLTNAGPAAAVTISAAGPDTQVYAAVYRQDSPTGPFQQIVTGSGAPVTLNVKPASGYALTDAKYFLAVAPLQFDSAVQPYEVMVTAPTLVGPASVAPDGATDVGPLLPISAGTADLIVRSSTAGSAKLYKLRSVADGPITLSTLITPIAISIYDATGATLLGVESRSAFGPGTFTFNATAGTTYLVRVANDSGQPAADNPFTLEAKQSYTGTAVAVGDTVGQQTGLSAPRVFRLTPPTGADLLVLRLTPDAGADPIAPAIAVIGANQPVVQQSAAAGVPIFLVIDLDAGSGPVDVLTYGTAGSGTMALSYAAVTLPKQLAIDQLQNLPVDIKTGQLSSTIAAAPFGQLTGVQFYQISASSTTIKAQGSGFIQPLLLRYVQQGGVLRLTDKALPDASGAATLTANLQGTLFYAAVAVSLNFSGDGTVQLSVSEPPPAAVGVGTVPEPHNPGDPFKSFLRIRDVVLQRPNQRDLFETILPFNMTGTPTLTFGPVSKNSPLSATVTVLDAANNVLATGTSASGQQLALALAGVTPAAFAGQKLRFLIEPATGQPLGDGTYTLQVEETTSDPTPFLLDDSLPPQAAQTLNFNSTVDGSFSSSQPQVQLFKLSLPSFSSYQIWTEDLDTSTNTNIRLYRAQYKPGAGIFGPQIVSFDSLAGVSPSLDYFPADRSSVDSRIVINNTHVFDGVFDDPANQPGVLYSPGLNTVYLAVKNEQGSQGRFRVHFEPVQNRLVGPGSIEFPPPPQSIIITLDPTSGQGSRSPFVGPADYVQFSTPHSLTSNPVVTVTSLSSHDIATGDLYDSAGNFLSESRALVINGAGVVSFTYQMAASSLYLMRVSLVNSATAQISISASTSTQNEPNKPASTDALTDPGSIVTESEPFDRAFQAPDGSFNHTSGILVGSGTQEKLLFSVPVTGPVHFSITTKNVNNGSFALYRGINRSGEVNGFLGGNLLDFVSTPAAGIFSFDDYLSPGFYYLRLVGSVSGGAFGAGSDTITGSVPAFDASNIILDPNSGQNSADSLQTVDRSPNNLFSTDFYEVNTPGGVQSSLTVNFMALASAPAGEADFALYKKLADGTFVQVGTRPYVAFDTNPTVPFTTADSKDSPTAGDQYFISINRDRLSSDILVAPGFKIPQSGDPDLVVKSIVLESDFGRTQVVVTVKNQAFAAAPFSHALLNFSNYTYPKDPAHPNFPPGSVLRQSGIGPLGTITYITDWDPDAPVNTASYTANFDRAFQEISFDNNAATVALSSVDSAFPTVALSLADPSLTGEPGVWGRYVSGVLGVRTDVRLTSNDANGDLYLTRVSGPFFAGTNGTLGATHTDRVSVDFGSLSPTSSAYPNLVDAYAIDAFGLKSQHVTQKIDVVVRPGFLTSIDWDPAAKKYNLAFVHNFVDYDKTLSQILGLNLPLVGDKHNQFLIGASAMGTASLDPKAAVSMPLTGRILLKALDSSLYDKSFNGSAQASDHLTVKTTLAIDSRTLNPTAAAVSFQLTNLNLFHYRTPLIKLYSYGVPGVASIDVGVRFGIDADLSAGVKVGIDPNVLFSPLIPTFPLGLLSPTFIQPKITGNATVEGDVDVLGFDLASLQGTVSLGLQITIGLDNNDPAKVFAFDDLFNHLAVKVDAILGIHLEADQVPLGDIWDYDYSKTFPVADSSKEGIITNDPGGGNAMPNAAFAQLDKFLLNPSSVLADGPVDGAPPRVRKGSDPLGPYHIDPTPQIILDPATGDGISVQVKNVSANPNVTTGNLVYSTRANGQWSALAALASTDVGNPTLAFSHDRANLNPAVVVYEADNGAADPATQSINQRLTDNEIRYRYYDGEGNWSAEQSITQDLLQDSSPSLAFNKVGAGVVAWVHNTSTTPMDESGNYSRDTQDIQAAVWDPATHTFSAPFSITSGDGVADTKPAAFVDADGNPRVVWVRDTPGGGNTLMFSVYDGAKWSDPAVLPITGLTPGGNFGSVAVGTDQLGRIDVLFSYRIPNADGSIDSRLFNRPGTKDQFGSPTPVEQIAQDGNFSHLRTTNSGDGSLVAYWQLGDGVSNGVFESTLARSVANPSLPWSTPTRLTSTTDLTQNPSLAVDTGGKLDVLYEDSVPKGEAAPASVTDIPVGVPMAPGVGSSSVAMLPELTFTNGLYFPYQDKAVVGSNTTGQATITNRGAIAAQVTVESFVGTPDIGTLIDTRRVNISAGGSYSYSQTFPVSAGSQTYSVRVSSATGEAISTDDDVSTATLNGLPDIAILSLTPSVGAPNPGQQVMLTAEVQNLGSVAVGPFDVVLYSGDRRFPQTHPTALLTQTVDTIAPGDMIPVSFPLTLPTTAGDYTYSAVADPANTIAEAVKSNNDSQYYIRFRADPAIVPIPLVTVDAVTAVLLDGSGVNNVTVMVPVSNLGNVDIANVPVILQLSRDGSDFVDVSTQTASLLRAGSGTTLTFTANGLSGDNTYRAIIDPALNSVDSNVSNNFGQTDLVIHGVADLSVPSVTLSSANPPQGSPLTVTAVIANTGIADATNVLVELFATPDGGDPIPVGLIRLDKVAALDQATATFAIDTSKLLGHYSLLVQVNRLHEVLESTELNNTATTDFTVGPPVVTPTNNTVNATAGLANTITLRRDPNDMTKDDVWINIAETEVPTQLALLAQPIVVNGGGLVDKLVLDTANGDPLPLELDLNGSFTTAAVAINARESIVLGHTVALNGNQFTVTGLTVDPTGKLDVGDGSIRVAYIDGDPLATIQGYLRTAYDGGKWDGGGITSSDAQANPKFAIGETDSADGVVQGQPANTILLRYVLTGDADENGKVDFGDLVTLARDYNKTGADWAQGNFDYSGKVGFADLVLLARNYNAAAAATPFVTAALGPTATLQALADLLDHLRGGRVRHGRSAPRP